MPEFFDIDITKNLLSAIDEFETLHALCSNLAEDEDVKVLVGEDLAPRLQGPYGFVFTKYKTSMNEIGEIGVFGPTRLQYTSIIPVVRYFGDLVEEIAKGW